MRRSLLSILFVLAGSMAVAPAAADAEYDFVTKWGSGGSGDGQFRSPYGIAIGPGDTIYVTDFGNGLGQNDRVEKFSSSGAFLGKWELSGRGTRNSMTHWGSPPTKPATSTSATSTTITSRNSTRMGSSNF